MFKDLFLENFNEGYKNKNEVKKPLREYAIEILKTIQKKNNLQTSFIQEPENFWDAYNGVMKVFNAMGLPEDNPNYKTFKKYFPKGYDKSIFVSESGNKYDAPYWQLNGNERSTIIRKAIKAL